MDDLIKEKIGPEVVAKILGNSGKALNNNIHAEYNKEVIIATSLWFLWYARCQRVFQNNWASSKDLCIRILKYTEKQKVLSNKYDQNKWKADSFKDYEYVVRSDGSFKDTLAGAGWTLNNEGDLVVAGACCLRANDAFEAELISLYSVLKVFLQENLGNFLLTDFQNPKWCDLRRSFA